MSSNKKGEETTTNTTKHPFFNKWLTEITSSFGKKSSGSTKHRVFCFKDNKPEFAFAPSDIPSRVADTDSRYSGENGDRRQGSAKYGKNSIVTQMYFENTSRNISLTSSDYLVPKFEHIDFNEFRIKDPHQIALENSWENLNSLKLRKVNDKIDQ